MFFCHVPLPDKVPRARSEAAGGMFEKSRYALQHLRLSYSLGRKQISNQLVQHFSNKPCRRSFIYFATRYHLSAISRWAGDLQTPPSPMLFPRLKAGASSTQSQHRPLIPRLCSNRLQLLNALALLMLFGCNSSTKTMFETSLDNCLFLFEAKWRCRFGGSLLLPLGEAVYQVSSLKTIPRAANHTVCQKKNWFLERNKTSLHILPPPSQQTKPKH